MDQPTTTIKLLKFEIWRHNISEIIFKHNKKLVCSSALKKSIFVVF